MRIVALTADKEPERAYRPPAASLRERRVAGRKRIDQRRAAETAAVTYNPLGASAVAVMANRFEEDLETLQAQVSRYRRLVTVAMCDLDGF